jgi:hypothetical protein
MAKTVDMDEEHQYEVGVFNQQVADLIATGQRHKHLKDGWAEIQYIAISAGSPDAARRKIERRYPPENGYVIASVEIVKDLD